MSNNILDQNPNSSLLLDKLSKTMKSISSCTWCLIIIAILSIPSYRRVLSIKSIFTICLSIVAIILFIRYIQLILNLDKLSMIFNDDNLKTGKNYLIISIISIIFFFIIVGSIVSYIFSILAYNKLYKWSENYQNIRKSPKSQEFANGFHSIYIGSILNIIIIGIFWIAVGYRKAANALEEDIKDLKISKVETVQEEIQKPIESESGSFGFCKNCGAPLKTPNDKFCRSCGQKLL